MERSLLDTVHFGECSAAALDNHNDISHCGNIIHRVAGCNNEIGGLACGKDAGFCTGDLCCR